MHRIPTLTWIHIRGKESFVDTDALENHFRIFGGVYSTWRLGDIPLFLVFDEFPYSYMQSK